MFTDLRAFLDQLRRDRDVVVVDVPVDARLEAAEIHRRVIAAGGPALLFTNVKGAAFPLATNLFGTPRRAELAFGRRPQRLIRRLVELVETIVPPTAGKLWGARDVVFEAMRIGMRRRGSGPVAEVVSAVPDLTRLPVLTTWEKDGGPFVTLPLVFTRHPDSGAPNLGMYVLVIPLEVWECQQAVARVQEEIPRLLLNLALDARLRRFPRLNLSAQTVPLPFVDVVRLFIAVHHESLAVLFDITKGGKNHGYVITAVEDCQGMCSISSRNRVTTCGSKCRPACSRMYSNVCDLLHAARYGRSDIKASHTSTIANKRAETGIASPFNPRG